MSQMRIFVNKDCPPAVAAAKKLAMAKPDEIVLLTETEMKAVNDTALFKIIVVNDPDE